MKNVPEYISKHFHKIDFLEEQGFEFYEDESLPSKPFCWRFGDIEVSYNRLITMGLAELKDYIKR